VNGLGWIMAFALALLFWAAIFGVIWLLLGVAG
jgi:hypothetical protein